MNDLNEFLNGLPPQDVIAVSRDIWLYGNAFAETTNGKKRRVSIDKWPKIIERHNARPIGDGQPGMVLDEVQILR